MQLIVYSACGCWQSELGWDIPSRYLATAENPVKYFQFTVVSTYTLSIWWAGIASLLTQAQGSALLGLHAGTVGMAALACLRTQQPENGAAFCHAAVQSAAFLQGHGKLDRMPGSETEVLGKFVENYAAQTDIPSNRLCKSRRLLTARLCHACGVQHEDAGI